MCRKYQNLCALPHNERTQREPGTARTYGHDAMASRGGRGSGAGSGGRGGRILAPLRSLRALGPGSRGASTAAHTIQSSSREGDTGATRVSATAAVATSAASTGVDDRLGNGHSSRTSILRGLTAALGPSRGGVGGGGPGTGGWDASAGVSGSARPLSTGSHDRRRSDFGNELIVNAQRHVPRNVDDVDALDHDSGLRYRVKVDLRLAVVLFLERLLLPLAVLLLPVLQWVLWKCHRTPLDLPLPPASVGLVIRCVVWICIVVTLYIYVSVDCAGDPCVDDPLVSDCDQFRRCHTASSEVYVPAAFWVLYAFIEAHKETLLIVQQEEHSPDGQRHYSARHRSTDEDVEGGAGALGHVGEVGGGAPAAEGRRHPAVSTINESDTHASSAAESGGSSRDSGFEMTNAFAGSGALAGARGLAPPHPRTSAGHAGRVTTRTRRSVSALEEPAHGSSSVFNPLMLTAAPARMPVSARTSVRAAIERGRANSHAVMSTVLDTIKVADTRRLAMRDAQTIWALFSPEAKDANKRRTAVCGFEMTFTLSVRAIVVALFHALLAPLYRLVYLGSVCADERSVFFGSMCFPAANITCGVYLRPPAADAAFAAIGADAATGCEGFADITSAQSQQRLSAFNILLGGARPAHWAMAVCSFVATLYLAYKLFRILGRAVSEFRMRQRLMALLRAHLAGEYVPKLHDFAAQRAADEAAAMRDQAMGRASSGSSSLDLSVSGFPMPEASVFKPGESAVTVLDFAGDTARAFQLATVLRACLIRASKASITSHGQVPFAYFLIGFAVSAMALVVQVFFSREFVIHTEQVIMLVDTGLVMTVAVTQIFYSLRSNSAQRRHGFVFFQHKRRLMQTIQRARRDLGALHTDATTAVAGTAPADVGHANGSANTVGGASNMIGVADSAKLRGKLQDLEFLHESMADYIEELEHWDEKSKFYGLRIDPSLLAKAVVVAVGAVLSQGSLVASRTRLPTPVIGPEI